jgi:CheY-like chemotaxis protein
VPQDKPFRGVDLRLVAAVGGALARFTASTQSGLIGSKIATIGKAPTRASLIGVDRTVARSRSCYSRQCDREDAGRRSHNYLDILVNDRSAQPCTTDSNIRQAAGHGSPHLSCASCNRNSQLRIAQLSDVSLISIIDDDESVRVATTALMRSLGHVAHSFASAEAFLQSADVDESSCLIVDVQMPRMSGVELQSALLSQGRRVPIIFMTGYPEKNIRSQILRSGAVCYISKPFRAQALIECIDKALKRQASHEDAGMLAI